MVQGAEKPDKGTVPSVAIDGARIRNLREGKKLTQLYVASVVGVTTDTISRWENNRYPSIRRDNAEKLASALEVELGEILRQEEAAEPSAAAPAAAAGSRRLLWGAVAIALAFISLAVYFFAQRAAPAPTAVRWLPRFAAPGEVVPVQVRVTRQPGDEAGFILKENLPDGVRLVSSLPPSSSTDAAGASVKWLIPGGSPSVVVSYTIRIPAPPDQRGEVKLGGEIVLRSAGANRTEATAGSSTIRIGSYHWADGNGDYRIDDDEIMPAYYLVEEMKGLGLDWKTIEAIWSGRGYRWDPRSGFTVLN